MKYSDFYEASFKKKVNLNLQYGGNHIGLPRWLSGKEFTCNAGSAGYTGSIPGSGRSPEKGLATQSSVLAWRNPWMREAWRATVHRVGKSET